MAGFCRAATKCNTVVSWAGEDHMINPAPGFWQIFGPLGPTAGPGILGNGPGSKISPGEHF